MPGFCYKLAQNLSSIFKMLTKHGYKMTAFPLTHVVQQKKKKHILSAHIKSFSSECSQL